MKAVVMAGGEGSRLRPLTLGRPKPMVPLVNRPMLEHILLLLKRHGIQDVILTVQYMASYIQDHIGDGSHLGMHVTYSVEEHPLGTAGSVRQAADELDDTFLVISGDALTDFDLTRIVDFHKTVEAMATLTLYRVENPLEYGVVILGEGGRIREFQEKPSWSEVLTDTINTGIYVLEPSIFEWYEKDQVFDFSKDLFPLLLRENKPLFGYVADGYWTDVGSLEEYMRATRDLLTGRVNIELTGEKVGDVWREDGVDIAPDAQLRGPIYLGRDVRVESGSVISGPTVIRANTVIEKRAHVDRSIISRNNHIGPGAELRGSLLGADCDIRANAVLFENTIVADGTIVGRGAVVQPNVKIWPHKEIEAGAVVSSSIIWGSRGRRVLFGRHGVSGLINVDFTPAMVARLAAAYASTLPVGARVTLTRDPAIPSRMLKRALASGLASAGVNVSDLSAVPVPVARFYTRVSDAVGGVHIHVSSEDRSVCDINFFDQNGMELDKGKQRSIETAFFREDFRRVHLDDIGTHDYAPGVIEQYTRAFLDAVDGVMVAHSRYSLAVDYSLGTTSDVLPGILRSLGCNVIDLNAERGLARSLRSAAEYDAALGQLARIVPALGFDLGAMLDVDGERLQVVDNDGESIAPMQVLAALAYLVFQHYDGAIIAVPSDAPNIFESLAAKHGGKVIRSRRGLQGLRAAATQKGVRLAGDGRGRMIFPALHPQFDAMFGLAQLLELLSRARATLHDVVTDLPSWHVQERDVPCPWDKKGRVMRLLGEQYREHRARGSEGIKIELGNEWVLVLPDPDEPQFHLVAEAQSDGGAAAMIDRYANIVSGLQHG